MKSHALLPLLALALLGGCSEDDYKKWLDGEVDKHSVRGVYQQTGYGQLLELNKDEYRLYQYNSRYCMNIERGARKTLVNEMREVKRQKKGEQLTFLLPEKGNAVFPVVTDKLKKLPDNCANPQAFTADPVTNFDYFWHSLNDHYAFFAERGINWAERYREFSPLVTANTSEEQLFAIMAEMISDFNDAHLGVDADIAGVPLSATGARTTRWEQMQINVANELGEDELDQVEQELLLGQLALMQTYVGSELRQADSRQPLYWGLSQDKVGYIFLAAMGGYAGPVVSPVADKAAAEKAFAQMMQELSGARAIIIDNRFNQGGYDDISRALANHFVTRDTRVLDKFARNRLATTDKQSLHLKPAKPGFSKPVYLLNSEASVSAAETFSLMLKRLPQVKLVGEASNGALSDMLDLQLPNGWSLSLSNEVYRDDAGAVFEVTGVPVDLPTPIFSVQDLGLGRQSIYDQVLDDLGRPYLPDTSAADLEALIQSAVDQGVVPGLALALVNEGRVVFSKGFGKASEQHPVTTDTPFALASVSKLFGGTLAALLVEQDKIRDNAQLSDQLGFALSLPEHYQPLRFSQLLSHTSGILDSEALSCSYYFLADNSSMLNWRDDHSLCPEPVPGSLEEFLPAYLQQSGQYYTEANFNQSPDFQPGSHFQYSNTATAVAAQWMAKTLGMPYAELSERSLLEPLGMHRSAWHLGDKVSAEDLADRYIWQPALERLEPLPDYSTGTWPDGDLKASLNDLLIFSQAVLEPNHPLLTDKIKQRMFSPLWDQPGSTGWNGVGYNWALDGDYAYHTGSDPGTSSLVLLNRQRRAAMLLLINTDDESPGFEDFYAELQRLGWQYLLAH